MATTTQLAGGAQHFMEVALATSISHDWPGWEGAARDGVDGVEAGVHLRTGTLVLK